MNQVTSKNSNPWAVESIMAFNYFLCPECDFQAKTPPSFETHAIENHPLSKNLFTSDFNALTTTIKSEENENNADEDIIETFLNDVQDKSYLFDIGIAEDSENYDDEFLKSDPDYQEDANCNTNNSANTSPDETKVKKQAFMNQLPEIVDENEEKKFYNCSKCSEVFNSLVDLGYHQNSVHVKNSGKHQCPSCQKSFANSTKLRIHIETVHEKKRVKCPLCESIVLKHGLRNHMAVSHQGDRGEYI